MVKVVVKNQIDIFEAAKLLEELLRSGDWISLYGYCMVEYEGRGASRSTLGDKHIMIKPSGSIIIHGPKGFRPENWQPDNSVFAVMTSDDYLVIKSIRRKPREVLLVKCKSIYSIMSLNDYSTGEFIMYVDEHEIRDFLLSNPSYIEKGFRPISREKPIEPGFIDIYGVDKDGNPVVVEIKRVKAGVDAVKQLEKYLLALEKHNIHARGILVAPAFSESAIKEAFRAKIKLLSVDVSDIRSKLVKEKPSRKKLTEFL